MLLYTHVHLIYNTEFVILRLCAVLRRILSLIGRGSRSAVHRNLIESDTIVVECTSEE